MLLPLPESSEVLELWSEANPLSVSLSCCLCWHLLIFNFTSFCSIADSIWFHKETETNEQKSDASTVSKAKRSHGRNARWVLKWLTKHLSRSWSTRENMRAEHNLTSSQDTSSKHILRYIYSISQLGVSMNSNEIMQTQSYITCNLAIDVSLTEPSSGITGMQPMNNNEKTHISGGASKGSWYCRFKFPNHMCIPHC